MGTFLLRPSLNAGAEEKFRTLEVFMGFFKRAKMKPATVTTQIRSNGSHPFGMLDSYVPLGGGDTRLYRLCKFPVQPGDTGGL